MGNQMGATAWIENGCGRAEVTIPRPIESVFDYVSDLRNMPVWWSSHATYRRVLGKGEAGWLYAWTMPVPPIPIGIPIAGITLVRERVRPLRFRYRIVTIGLYSGMTYTFTSVEGGTRVSLEVSAAVGSFVEVVAPVFDQLSATLSPI